MEGQPTTAHFRDRPWEVACRWGVACWRPACAFRHEASRERVEAVKEISAWWAAAGMAPFCRPAEEGHAAEKLVESPCEAPAPEGRRGSDEAAAAEELGADGEGAWQSVGARGRRHRKGHTRSEEREQGCRVTRVSNQFLELRAKDHEGLEEEAPKKEAVRPSAAGIKEEAFFVVAGEVKAKLEEQLKEPAVGRLAELPETSANWSPWRVWGQRLGRGGVAEEAAEAAAGGSARAPLGGGVVEKPAKEEEEKQRTALEEERRREGQEHHLEQAVEEETELKKEEQMGEEEAEQLGEEVTEDLLVVTKERRYRGGDEDGGTRGSDGGTEGEEEVAAQQEQQTVGERVAKPSPQKCLAGSAANFLDAAVRTSLRREELKEFLKDPERWREVQRGRCGCSVCSAWRSERLRVAQWRPQTVHEEAEKKRNAFGGG